MTELPKWTWYQFWLHIAADWQRRKNGRMARANERHYEFVNRRPATGRDGSRR